MDTSHNCIWCFDEPETVMAEWLIEWGAGQDHVHCCDPCFVDWQANNHDWAQLGCRNTPSRNVRK